MKEEELKEIKNILKQSAKLAEIGLHTSMIIHEMKQPLFGIKSFAELLLNEIKEESPVRKKVEGILKQALNLERMLTRLREFMRATEGEKVSVDIKKVIEDTIELISHRLKKFNIQHILEISNTSNVLGEPNELQQVILNLLDNAIDAVEGVKNGMIFIKTYEDDKSVNIIIGDSGRGIPPDIREKIFEPFFTTKEKGKGTGLGLYISSQIIKEHGGRLYLTEEIPDGVPADIKTAFVISLPPFRVKNE